MMTVRDELAEMRAGMRSVFDALYTKHRGERPYVPPQLRPAYLDALPSLATIRALRDGASDAEWEDGIQIGVGPERALLRIDLPHLPSLSAPSHATSVWVALLLAGTGDEPIGLSRSGEGSGGRRPQRSSRQGAKRPGSSTAAERQSHLIGWWLHTGWRAGGNFEAEGPFDDARAAIARGRERTEEERARLDAKVPDAAALAAADYWDEGVDTARVGALLAELVAKSRAGRRCVVAPDASLQVFAVGEYADDETGCLRLPHIQLTEFGAREHLRRVLEP